jgi:hypothetical protein
MRRGSNHRRCIEGHTCRNAEWPNAHSLTHHFHSHPPLRHRRFLCAQELQSADTDPTAIHRPTVSVAVTNVVCSVDMGCSVDMMDVALRGRNTEFNKKNGEGGVTLAQRGGSTATVHASGKVVFMGAQSEAAARVSARRHVRSIQKLG